MWRCGLRGYRRSERRVSTGRSCVGSPCHIEYFFNVFFFYYLLNLCIFRIMRGGEMGDILVYVGED